MNAAAPAPKPATILIVDDNPANLAMLVDHLETRGNRILVAQDGEEGIGRARFAAPDLILLDARMPPGIDGLETCRRLKADPRTRDVPVIFMTAMGATADKLAGFEAGAVDYVTKPFSLGEVAARIDTHLALRALQKQLAAQNRLLEAEVGERRAAQAELQRHRDSLESLVVQRTAELRAARDQAEAVNRGKSVFLAGMSHELRNPLQVVLTSAELLGQSYADPVAWAMTPEQWRHHLGAISGSGERLLELLDKVLDLARLEAGRMPMMWRTVNPVELAREVEAELQPRLAAKSMSLLLRPEDPPQGLAADRERIAQVLRNLIDNAIRCSPRGSTVILTLSGGSLDGGPAARTALRLVVADQGETIAEHQLDSVFDSFAQDSARRCAAGGVRLSLDICRHIVAAHHGRILARNRSGGGCEFEVLLPLVQPDGAARSG